MLPNVNEETRCTAHTKHNGGQPCKNLAVGDTGVCRFHGGKGGRPPNTGLYSGQSKESLNKKIERAEKFDKSVLDEIALMKGVMLEVTEALNAEEVNIFDSKTLLKLQTTADSIRKLVETQMKIESENKFTLSMTDLKLFIAQTVLIIKDILSEYITDDEMYQAALKKTQRMLGEIKILDGEVKESNS
jgi:hypothetical protein